MRTVKNIINLFFLLLGHLIPRSKRKIVFGAWDGNSYSDNPKFLFEYFFDHPEWRIVWIGCKQVKSTIPPLPSHASFAVRHSLKGMWHALTAGTWVFSHSPNDIAIVAVWGRALLVDVNHGAGFKKVGVESPSFINGERSVLDSFWSKVFSKNIYLTVSSRMQWQSLHDGFPKMFKDGRQLAFGSPALDFIINNKDNVNMIQAIRKELSRLFNLPGEKKWIVYAPTFRWLHENNFSFQELEPVMQARLFALLDKHNAVIVEKLHPHRVTAVSACKQGYIFTIGGSTASLIEPHMLWLAADALISDYSSCVTAFYLQRKPVIHFAYDYEYYKEKDTGLVADLEDIRFGAVAYNLTSLFNVLEDIDSARNQSGRLTESLIEYEKGHSCEKCFDFIKAYFVT